MEAKQTVSMHWMRKALVFLQENVAFLVTEEGMLVPVGTQNIDFLTRKCMYLQGTSGGQTSCVDALDAKNISFLKAIFTFLVTEEGMLAAVGTQNIDFLAGRCTFLTGKVVRVQN